METTVEVHESSQVSEVRRVVADAARAQGMSAEDAGRCALVATEVSTNLIKYGKGGSVSVGTYFETGVVGVQIVAADKGPGFSNFVASSRDGHSTGGSLGIGLGAILRASDVFDVFTVPEQGSAILCRVAKGGAKSSPPAGALVVGSRTVPIAGETECGDAWAHARAGSWQRLCVVDGLGHGPLAASAAVAATAVFRAAVSADTPVDILVRAHAELKSTRGAVMAVAAIDVEAGRLLFAGVGNISAVLYGDGASSHLLSVEGVVGYNARNMKLHERPWNDGCILVMASDGLSTRWNLARYPGLQQRHPALVAAVLHRDFARSTDDATVVVVRQAR